MNNSNSNVEYIDETIYIIQYPEGKLPVSYGVLDKILEDKKYNFNHKCSTKVGSSGSPILNNNNKLIGIHKESSNCKNYNRGTFLNYPIKEFIKSLANIIDKINFYINENKKNLESISNFNINTPHNEFNKININTNFTPKTIQEIEVKDGKYIGECVNGVAEGRGTCYFINGDRYEGNMKNNIKEGKGIYYFIDGNRYEGDFRNNLKDGKGIFYFKAGDIFEGDFKDDYREGKGIYYYSNGIREMGDYHKGNRIGKQVALLPNGQVEVHNY